jgi:SWIM zinc finger
MLTLNPTTLAAVAEQACRDAAQHGRWLVAIGRALVELDSNPWIARNPDGHGLLIGSPSGSVYSSNGQCQCKAFEHGQPCWHRAAARLVRLHDAREAAAQIEGTAIAAAQLAGLVTMPEGDRLDTDGMRVARTIAAQRATAQINELFA